MYFWCPGCPPGRTGRRLQTPGKSRVHMQCDVIACEGAGNDVQGDQLPTKEGDKGAGVSQRCAFLTSARYAELAQGLPRNSERARLVEGLIDATGVLERMSEVAEVNPFVKSIRSSLSV